MRLARSPNYVSRHLGENYPHLILFSYWESDSANRDVWVMDRLIGGLNSQPLKVVKKMFVFQKEITIRNRVGFGKASYGLGDFGRANVCKGRRRSYATSSGKALVM